MNPMATISPVIRLALRANTLKLAGGPLAASRSRISPQFSGSGRCAFSTALAFREKKYTPQHEWIELSEDNKTGTIGISVYAAKSLGDVVYVELPMVDTVVKEGDTLGAVESVKSASDIYTPVAGKVFEANSVLEDSPATINKDPEGDGWFAKLELESGEAKNLDTLMDVEEYRKFTEE